MSIWDDAKKNLAELYTVTADKTSELAKVTSRRYDKFGLSRDMERQFSELGSIVYLALQEDRREILESPEVAALVARITELEHQLRSKDDEIDQIKREHAERKAAAAAAGASATVTDEPAPVSETVVEESVPQEPSDDADGEEKDPEIIT